MADPDERAERAALLGSLEGLLRDMERAGLPRAVRALVDADITLQQLKVLTMLTAAPDGMPTRALARACGVSLASMSTMVDRLVAQGVVRRRVDARDQRVRRLHATEQGREVVRRVAGIPSGLALDTLERLDLRDLRALERGIRAVAAARAAEA